VGLDELTDAELAAVRPELTGEVRTVLTVRGSISSRDGYNGTAPHSVAGQLVRLVERAAEARVWAQTPPGS
jgi:argininosuccinate lyase